MTRVAIITYVANKSSKLLAAALEYNGIKAKCFNMNETEKRDYTEFDSVFAYGASCNTFHNHRFNLPKPTSTCIDKIRTFKTLRALKLPIVEFCTSRDEIPKRWEIITIRKEANGRKAENIEYIHQGSAVPLAELYTEYFMHKYEYRIVVFMGKVVGRYYKREENGDWFFNVQARQGFEEMDKACVKAAKALGIDYVGFDVVANTKKDFRILEANSAPTLMDEAENAIVEYYLNKE